MIRKKPRFEDYTITELETTKDQVRRILRDDERAKNSDTWLVYLVCSEITKVYIPFEDFKKLPSFESITRLRRMVQKEDPALWPTDVQVRERRNLREEIFHDYFRPSE